MLWLGNPSTEAILHRTGHATAEGRAVRPRLLDLFCGAGGCSVGYARAGFDVEGVDIEPHPTYPFPMRVTDAMRVLDDEGYLRSFDVIHASPPCKSENPLRHLHDVEHPNLLGPTLDRLRALEGLMWVVENVSATDQMPDALMLCGAAFGLGATCRDGRWRPLKRHRLFESSHWLMGHGCACSGRQAIGVYGGGHSNRGPGSRAAYQGFKAEAAEAMGIDWMVRDDLSQAIPPAYTTFVGGQLLEHLRAAA